jgi:hypothetical protein
MLVEQDDGPYFAYVPGDTQLIHNANVLACAVLARTGRITGNEALVATAAAALDVTLAAQRRDGSWPYAQASQNGWVDNFHTGYVLEGLATCAASVPAVVPALRRGFAYWEDALFLTDGGPKYYPDQTYPLDTHCYAQAIETWLALRAYDDGAVGRAEHTAGLLIDRMLDDRGYAYFQSHRFWTCKTPFVRWSTAPTFRALAHLLMVRAERAAAGAGGDPRWEAVGAGLD